MRAWSEGAGLHFDGEGNDVGFFHHLRHSYKALEKLRNENHTEPHARPHNQNTRLQAT